VQRLDKELIIKHVVENRLKDFILKGVENEQEAEEIIEEYKDIIRHRIDESILKAKDLNDNKIKMFTLVCAETDKQLFEYSAEEKYNYLILSKFRDRIVVLGEQARCFAKNRYNNDTKINYERAKEIAEHFKEASIPLSKKAYWISFIEEKKAQLTENLDYASGKVEQFPIQVTNEI